MQLPHKLKGFNLFFEGSNLYGLIADVTRPKIEFKTEDYLPGGGLTDLKIIHGLEALQIEITAGGYTADTLRQMGGAIAGKTLRYQGALQQDDSEDYAELVGEARGRLIAVDYGTDKQGEGGEVKITMALTYWREALDGKTTFEVDALGNKLVIGDKDLRAGMRRALGL